MTIRMMLKNGTSTVIKLKENNNGDLRIMCNIIVKTVT